MSMLGKLVKILLVLAGIIALLLYAALEIELPWATGNADMLLLFALILINLSVLFRTSTPIAGFAKGAIMAILVLILVTKGQEALRYSIPADSHGALNSFGNLEILEPNDRGILWPWQSLVVQMESYQEVAFVGNQVVAFSVSLEPKSWEAFFEAFPNGLESEITMALSSRFSTNAQVIQSVLGDFGSVEILLESDIP